MQFFTDEELEIINAKEFVKQLAQYADSQRRMIEVEVSGFDTEKKAKVERIKRAHNDYGYFCETYFPHYVFMGRSVFHQHIFDDVPAKLNSNRSAKEVYAAPRGEAKSTLLTQLLPIWCVVTGRKKFCVIIMDALEQATMMLEAIKVELESNPRLCEDYPNSTSRGLTWQRAMAVTKCNVLLLAAGSGKKLRGFRHGPHRVDLVNLDDIENDKNVKNPDLRESLESWIDKSILKLKGVGKKMDLFYVGTVLHYDSVLARKLKHPRWNAHRFQAIIKWPDRMDLWQRWEEIILNESEDDADEFYELNSSEMDEGAVVSWPEGRPLVELMKERSDDHDAFDSEMQNDPSDSENATFKDLEYWVQTSDWVFYGAVDPSLGKKNRSNDPSAILVGGWDKNKGRLDVVVADIAKRKPNLIISKTIEYQREFRCILWAFESVQFQEFCRQILIEKSIQENMPVPAKGVIPHTDKTLRIESIEPFVTNGNIRFNRNHSVLLEQLQHFPNATNDDGPDALQMLWELASRNAGGIPKIHTAGRRTHLQGLL